MRNRILNENDRDAHFYVAVSYFHGEGPFLKEATLLYSETTCLYGEWMALSDHRMKVIGTTPGNEN